MRSVLKSLALKVLILLHRIPVRIFFRTRKSNNEVLIIKIDAIGDAIVWLDTAKEYRKIYPSKKLVLLYNKAWEEIALKLPYFDEFIAFDSAQFWKSFLYRLQILSIINKHYFDVLVNPTYSRSFFYQDWLVNNIKAKEKIGSVGDYKNTNNTMAKLSRDFDTINPKLRKIGDSWYSRLVAVSPKPEMELIRNAEFIRNAYGLNFKAQLPLFPFPLPVYEPLKNRNYCVLFMGAATERRAWQVEKFAEIIDKIPADLEIVLCGGKGEAYIYDQLMSLGTVQRELINLFGKTTLIELFSIIKGAKFVITNETSASHITVATRTPSICILGGGHYGRFQPYQVEEIAEEDRKYLPATVSLKMECFNCGWICKYDLIGGRWKCVADIPVKMVEEKLAELIK
jgi:ADP-heptose:LPS heptosyltransferase